jgi:hypothetical protein
MRWKKLSGAWLMVISIAAACSLCLSEVARYRPTDSSRLFLLLRPGIVILMRRT